jgi:hypothetical protein
MAQTRAATPADAFWTLDPFALVNPADPWHSEIEAHFKPARYGVVPQLTRRLRPGPSAPSHVHVAIVGHKGTGKTTQVRKAMADLAAAGVYGVFVDALAMLDQSDLSFGDVILVITNAVVSGLSAAGVDVPREETEAVRLWFAEELLTETHRNELLGSIEAEAKASVGISLLAKLTAKITGVLKSHNEYRQEIRRRAERDPADLVRRVNLLLDAASRELGRKLGRDQKLAVVVDNLEKLGDRRQVDAAVLRRADELRRLRSHLVLFFDPADQYAPVTVQPSQAFETIVVPMLPIRERTDAPDHVDDAAVAAVRDLLARRVDADEVFDPVDRCVRDLARLSGGRLRDVFALARLASELADPSKVTPDHVTAAARKLRGERVVAARPEQWARLAEIHRDKQVANDPSDAHLLLHSLVLNYDGDPWWDVHPFVRLDERFDRAWQGLSRLRKGADPG